MLSSGPSADGNEGYRPQGPLTEGPNGNLYGTMLYSRDHCPISSGFAFQVSKAGKYTVLHQFNGLVGNRDDSESDESDGRYLPLAALNSSGGFYEIGGAGGLRCLRGTCWRCERTLRPLAGVEISRRVWVKCRTLIFNLGMNLTCLMRCHLQLPEVFSKAC